MTDRYFEETDRIDRKLILSCELATEREEEPVDDEETRSLLLHERLLAA